MGLKLLLLLICSVFVSMFFATNVSAQYIAPQLKQPSSQINLNKQVKNPQNGQFVENLNFNDYRFLPEQEVIFKLEVRNSGQVDLNNIQIKDKVPDFVDFISGPGNFDNNTKTLNFTIDRLKPGESKAYELTAKIKKEAELPANMGTCLTNFAEARMNELVSQDTAVFCVETRVLGVTRELPKTGMASSVAVVLASSSLLVTSLYLLRRN